jgi:adenylylsulfate kinase
VRDTAGIDAKNPFDFQYVRARIEHSLREYEGRFLVVQIPNIMRIFYDRDVGYVVERIDLAQSLQAISATDVRARLSRSDP